MRPQLLLSGLRLCKLHRKSLLSSSCLRERVTYFSIDTSLQPSDRPPYRVLFFGTDQFALHHLKALHVNRLQGDSSVVKTLDVTICTDKCIVKNFAEANQITTHRWPLHDLQHTYDIGVVVSFGQLIPARVIRSFPLGILNVHPSLLPAWRGSSPLISTVLSGSSTSGVSIMSIDPAKFDTGPLLSQTAVNLPDSITSLQLVDLMAEHGAPKLLDCLERINTLQRQSQPEKSPTPRATKLKSHNAFINWEVQCVRHIDRQYRAISELHPLRTRLYDKNISLCDMVSPTELKDHVTMAMRSAHLAESAPPGTPVYHKQLDALCVKCKDGWVGFRRVVIKKPMSALAFHNGYLSKYATQETPILQSQDNGLNYFWT